MFTIFYLDFCIQQRNLQRHAGMKAAGVNALYKCGSQKLSQVRKLIVEKWKIIPQATRHIASSAYHFIFYAKSWHPAAADTRH